MNQRRKSKLFGAALAALSASCIYVPSAQAVVYLWSRTGSSANFNNYTNFLDALPVAADPTIGRTQDIVFSSATATNQSSQIGTAYTINSLTILDGYDTSMSIPSSGATNPQLTITGYVIANNNTVNTSIGNYNGSGSTFNIEFAGNDVNFDVNTPNVSSGAKYLYLDDPIAGTGAIVKTGQGLLILDRFSSNWTGDANGVTLYLDQGIVRTGGASNDSNDYQFGTGIVDNESNNDVNISASSVTKEGGGGTRMFANEFKLGGTGQISFGGSYGFSFTAGSSFVLTSPKPISFTYASEMDGVISSPGGFGFTKTGGGSLMLTNANTYAGPTITSSDIALNGANASCANSALTISSAGSVEFEYVNPSVSNNVSLNLIPTTVTRFASATINGGSLTADGASAGNSNDVITGALTLGAGQSTITANAASGTNTTITVGSAASTGGTALFRGPSLGAQSVGSGSGTSNIIFQFAPTMIGGAGALNATTTSILPWAVGDSSPTGTGTDFVTVGANGVQLLATYADQTTFASGNSTLDNVKLTGPVSITSPTTANSLILNAGSSVEGGGTLTINSGAILATIAADIGGSTPGTLNFNSAEGIITVTTGNTLTIGSNITGTNGITKSGPGTLVLSAANSYSGITTLSSGVLQFSPGSLGSSSIQFNGGTLQFATGNTADISASIAPLTSTAVIDTNDNAVNFASAISGINPLAGLNKTTGTGTLMLSAANSYQGATTVSAGSIELNNANAIANSTLTVSVDNGATFATGISSYNVGGLAGTNALTLQDTSGAAINLKAGGNNANTTYSGNIGGSGSLTKSGTGTLTLTGSNNFSGGVTLSGGMLGFANGALGGGPITFAANAALQWSVPSTANADNTQDISSQIQPIPSGVTAGIDPQNGTVIFAHALSGGGSLNKLNTGTLVLTAANLYSGGTTISGGYLQLGNAGNGTSTTGSITGNVTDNATLIFDRTDDVNFMGSITGTGSIINQNAIVAGNVGTLTLSNSANNISGYLEPNSPIIVAANMAAGQISGASTLSITAGKLTVSAQSLLNNINDLNISGSAQLDLTNNSLYIHDTTQLSGIVGLLTTGYSNGLWNGPGIITSRSAANNYYTTLGYAVVNLGTVASPNDVIYIKYTLPGDTNLDGTVNNTDLTNLVPATSGATWSTGDFNYDGKVDADDYSLFQLGAALGSINSIPAPEPGVLAVGALAAPLFIRRRKS